MYAHSYPALTGETVTQGHANYCAAHGHATYTQDGIVAPYCPRCGVNTTRTPAQQAAYDRLMGDAGTVATQQAVPTTRVCDHCHATHATMSASYGDTEWVRMVCATCAPTFTLDGATVTPA